MDNLLTIYNQSNHKIKKMLTKVFKNIFKFSTKNTAKYTYARDIPPTLQRNHMNLFTAINSAIDICL